MAKKRWNYFVAVDFRPVDENKPVKTKYVTSLDNDNNYAHWDYGEKALPLGLHYAEDIVFGLCCNGYWAYIIKAPNYMEFKNPPKEKE